MNSYADLLEKYKDIDFGLTIVTLPDAADQDAPIKLTFGPFADAGVVLVVYSTYNLMEKEYQIGKRYKIAEIDGIAEVYDLKEQVRYIADPPDTHKYRILKAIAKAAQQTQEATGESFNLHIKEMNYGAHPNPKPPKKRRTAGDA